MSYTMLRNTFSVDVSPLRGSVQFGRTIPTAHAVGYRPAAAPRLVRLPRPADFYPDNEGQSPPPSHLFYW